MQSRFFLLTACAFLTWGMTACSTSPPPAIETNDAAETAEKNRAEELRRLDGSWLLKARRVTSDRGTYSLNPEEEGDRLFRIKDGVMEKPIGDEPWVKYATLAIGADAQSLQCTKADAAGQQRVLAIRYKLEGDTLILVQDLEYLDQLPDSFELEAGVDRQRQISTYVRTGK